MESHKSKSPISPNAIERLRILNEVKNGHLTQIEAAKILGISDRQLRRPLKTLEEEGVEDLVNKNTGQAGHHRKPDEEKNNILILHKVCGKKTCRKQILCQS
jgi:DeoR/GlpR family transcriptional regulator of sugar metabolism